MNEFEFIKKRYEHNSMFHTLVDSFTKNLLDGIYSYMDLKDAMTLAYYHYDIIKSKTRKEKNE